MILANIKWLLFTRAIRKTASSTLSAALQLFLLIKWRSLRTLLSSDFRASTESGLRRVRVNCSLKHWQRTKVSLFYFWKMNFWTRWIWRQGKRSLIHLWVSSCGLSPFAPDIMKITILRRESDVSGNQRNPKVLRRGRQSGGSIKRHWPFRGKRRILCAAWTVGVEFVKILFVDFLN